MFFKGGDDDGGNFGNGGGGGGGGGDDESRQGVPPPANNGTFPSFGGRGGSGSGATNVKFHDPSPAHILRDEEDPKKFTVMCSIVIDRPVDEIFGMLTDFDRVSEFLDDLSESSRVTPTNNGKTTVIQGGIERIMGINFKVKMKLAMEETGNSKKRVLTFNLLESMLMQECQGSSTISALGPQKSLFEYSITIRPKGMLPVGAPMENRMKAAIPGRLAGTAVGVEKWRIGEAGDVTVLAGKPKGGRWPWSRKD
jgi:hypothetical protein